MKIKWGIPVSQTFYDLIIEAYPYPTFGIKWMRRLVFRVDEEAARAREMK